MPRNHKILLAVLAFYVIFDFILGSLVGIYIWDKTESSTAILQYYLVLFSSILIFSQLSSKLLNFFSPKTIYISSIFIGLIQTTILLLFQDKLRGLVIPLAVISGAGIGIQSVSYNIVVGSILENDSSTKFFSLKSTVMNLVNIFSVPIITYLIAKSGSYNFSYIFGAVVGIIVIVLISRISLSSFVKTINSSYTLGSIIGDSDIKLYLVSRFLFGIFNGQTWGIIGIVTYQFVNNVSTWGIIATIFNILTITGSLIYGKLGKEIIYKSIAAMASLLFGSVALILATNWNFITFLIYQTGLVVLNIAFSIYYEKLMFNIINQSDEVRSRQKDILRFGELFLGFGRIISVGALLILRFDFENDLYLRILFIVLASIPIIILNTLSHTRSFRGNYAILDQA